MNKATRRSIALLAAALLAACGGEQDDAAGQNGAFVLLFEWRWSDIAKECEEHLGPAGYAAVQVSPPNEHIPGPAWWTRYQPVSYRIESRSGTREEFASMIRRCGAAGVDVYADAVVNHMADIGAGIGVAGSAYSEFSYPVPYDYDDFHHCGRNEDGRIADYQDRWEVQNCQLGLLADIDTGKPDVQERIAAYLNDLLDLGVAGFRIDAAKHMHTDDLAAILAHVDGSPFVYQEVIDRGNESIRAQDYVKNGAVTEFRYADTVIEAFTSGELGRLTGFGTDPAWLPSEQAVVFIDNHDTQRSHLSSNILSYKTYELYARAVVFMLAYPYGYPLVMSSYAFDDDDQGPPGTSPHESVHGCGNEWVCEHRGTAIGRMVQFRNTMIGAELVNWHIIDGAILSFGRGNKGHIVINNGNLHARLELETKLPAGKYVDVLGSGTTATANADGMLIITVAAQSAAVFALGDLETT